MAKTTKTATTTQQNTEVLLKEKPLVNDQSESLENEDFFEDEEEDEFSDDEETEDTENDEEEKTAEEEPKELTGFAKICKEYLTEQAKTDEELAKSIVYEDEAFSKCAKWIEEEVKKSITNRHGCQIGVLSDENGYTMMKEFFTDGVYLVKIEEEKEKAEQDKKKAEEKAKKEALRKAKEEEEKRKAEEEKRREEEWKRFMETGETDLSNAEIEREKFKHLKQQDLFDF